MVFKDIPEIGIKQGQPIELVSTPTLNGGVVPSSPTVTQKPQGCGCEAGAGGLATGAWLGLGVLALLRRKRRS
jgi:MYXO-CTERM domain-containing protein